MAYADWRLLTVNLSRLAFAESTVGTIGMFRALDSPLRVGHKSFSTLKVKLCSKPILIYISRHSHQLRHHNTTEEVNRRN